VNRDILEGNWKKMKGKVKQEWGKLTDSELEQIDGKAHELVGLVQERYGYSREEAEKKVDEWASRQ
jgi:uncharacterized protein YjbJ (UPF0337 family)